MEVATWNGSVCVTGTSGTMRNRVFCGASQAARVTAFGPEV